MSLNSSLKEVLENVVESLNISEHPYFKKLSNGEMTKEQFLNSQIEFAPLVSFFNRPMALVISNIPDALLRMALVDNLWEEHGKGNPEKVHGKTILKLIDRLGGDSSSINDEPTANIKIFNDALRGASIFQSYQFATAMFSGIERAFVDISSIICQSIIDQGWLEEEKITHYGLHKEIDIQHAEDFLHVVNSDWEKNESIDEIKSGIEFGAKLFLNVYTGFYNNIK